MPTYVIGRITFPRKKDALARVREILHNTPLYQQLVGEDARLVLGVLARHPRADQKLAGGIVGLTVAINEDDTGLSSRGFQIIRPNGSLETFSYIRALAEKDPVGASIDEACRYAVSESIYEFKCRVFGSQDDVCCSETGKLVGFEGSDVHHSEPWPFKKIVNAFIEQHGVPAVWKRGNGDFGSEFVSGADALKFREFHDARAVLQIVSRDAHYRLRHAQLKSIAAEDSDNAEIAQSDLDREFPNSLT
jgi:hypothetical protein